MPFGYRMTATQKARVEALRAKYPDLTVVAIAKRFNVHETTIRKILGKQIPAKGN